MRANSGVNPFVHVNVCQQIANPPRAFINSLQSPSSRPPPPRYWALVVQSITSGAGLIDTFASIHPIANHASARRGGRPVQHAHCRCCLRKCAQRRSSALINEPMAALLWLALVLQPAGCIQHLAPPQRLQLHRGVNNNFHSLSISPSSIKKSGSRLN